MTDTVSLDRLAAATAAVLEVPLVVASVFDGARQIFVGAHGLIEPLCTTRWTDLSSAMCRNVSERGRPILVQDRRRTPPDAMQGWGGFEIAAFACVPLPGGDGAPLGSLAAIDSSRRTWRGRDLVVLRAFADATGAVLDRGRMRHDYDRLAESAHHDELTGLLNRRGFGLVAESQRALGRRQRTSGLLLYFDLDDLKGTNDRDGHAAGDDVLRTIASVLRASFREADAIARFGGDEFVVFALDAPEHELAVISARLATELARGNSRDRRAIAWSVGVLTIGPDELRPLDELIAEADRRMYSAKRDTHRDLGLAARAALSPSSSG